MAPCRRAEVAGIIVRVSGPREAVIGHVVPFLARDFAGLTTDAHCRVGEETDFDVFLHVIVPPLVSAVSSFADHRLSIFSLKKFVRDIFGICASGPSMRATVPGRSIQDANQDDVPMANDICAPPL